MNDGRKTVTGGSGAVAFKYGYDGELNELRDAPGARYRLEYGDKGVHFVHTPDGRGTDYSYNARGNFVAVRAGVVRLKVDGRFAS